MTAELVNLTDYPLDRPDSAAYRELTAHWRDRLAADGFIVLPDFLTPKGLDTFNAEIANRRPTAHYSDHGPSSYFDRFDCPLPMQVLRSRSYMMGRDRLIDTQMDALYHWDPLRRFAADILGHEQIYLHEDPCNALIVQLYETGCEVGWHFDRTLFTCIVNLSEPDSGGIFECVPDLRNGADENLDDVWDVLQGRSDKVRRYHVQAGAFTLTRGRHTFHRVAPVGPGRARTSLVLTYELEPGVMISDADRRMIFGADAPVVR